MKNTAEESYAGRVCTALLRTRDVQSIRDTARNTGGASQTVSKKAKNTGGKRANRSGSAHRTQAT